MHHLQLKLIDSLIIQYRLNFCELYVGSSLADINLSIGINLESTADALKFRQWNPLTAHFLGNKCQNPPNIDGHVCASAFAEFLSDRYYESVNYTSNKASP